jgi:hypothetical protein
MATVDSAADYLFDARQGIADCSGGGKDAEPSDERRCLQARRWPPTVKTRNGAPVFFGLSRRTLPCTTEPGGSFQQNRAALSRRPTPTGIPMSRRRAVPLHCARRLHSLMACEH